MLDQQVIDVFGRKVVRVNDLDLLQESVGNRPVLKVGSVDVGPRGAIRRLLKGRGSAGGVASAAAADSPAKHSLGLR